MVPEVLESGRRGRSVIGPRREKRRGTVVLICGLHLRTRVWAAELGDCAVKQVDLVVKVDDIDGEPFILVLTLRQANDFSQAATSQSRFGELLKLPTVCALSSARGSERGPRATTGVAARRKHVSI